MTAPDEKRIGNIGNYYGGLSVRSEDGKHYWSIENYDGHDWKEIPVSLYTALVEYEEDRKRALHVPEAGAHPCPYRQEIDGDDSLCTCSPEKTRECAEDI